MGSFSVSSSPWKCQRPQKEDEHGWTYSRMKIYAFICFYFPEKSSVVFTFNESNSPVHFNLPFDWVHRWISKFLYSKTHPHETNARFILLSHWLLYLYPFSRHRASISGHIFINICKFSIRHNFCMFQVSKIHHFFIPKVLYFRDEWTNT